MKAGSSRPDDTWVVGGALLIALLGIATAWILIGAPPIVGIDDANIFFVYARNLVAGEGAVWVPGGERVEGFTSLLWTGIVTLAYLVGGPTSVEAILLVVSILLTAVPIGVVLALLPRSQTGTSVGLVWIAGLAGYFGWSGFSLMDTAVWSALLHLLLLAVTFHIRSPASTGRWVMALVALIAFTRPESMVVIPIVVGGAWVCAPGLVRTWCSALAVWAVSTLGLTGFRILYFGYPLPNTYYAKVPPNLDYRLGQGFAYLGSFCVDHPFVAGVVTLTVLWGAWALTQPVRVRAPANTPPWLAAVMLSAGLGATVLAGGDHFLGYRFLQPFLPALALPLARAGDWIAQQLRGGSHRTIPVRVGAIALGATALIWIAGEWKKFVQPGNFPVAFALTVEGRQMGSALNEAFPDVRTAPTVGVWRTGAVAYQYHGPTLDLLGLNWVAMGHSPGDRKGIRDHAAFDTTVFWTKPPELMLPTPVASVRRTGCPVVIWEDILRGLVETERFLTTYEPIAIGADQSTAVFAYARSDWRGLESHGVRIFGREACRSPANLGD